MNLLELKAERVRNGKSIKDMADALDITYDAYIRKEKGEVGFSTDQIIITTRELNLTAELINKIFFDDKLPIGVQEKTG